MRLKTLTFFCTYFFILNTSHATMISEDHYNACRETLGAQTYLKLQSSLMKIAELRLKKAGYYPQNKYKDIKTTDCELAQEEFVNFYQEFKTKRLLCSDQTEEAYMEKATDDRMDMTKPHLAQMKEKIYAKIEHGYCTQVRTVMDNAIAGVLASLSPLELCEKVAKAANEMGSTIAACPPEPKK